MAFIDAVAALNKFKRRRIIRDYAIIGAVAATAYMEPVFTEDIDVVILADSDEEYLRAYAAIAAESETMDGMHHILGGVPVQIFPSTVMPLYRDAVEQAKKVRIDNIRAKVATAEHLILLYLTANRPRDRLRVGYLLEDADESRLQSLLERFDDSQKTLAVRLRSLRGSSVPRKGAMASPPEAHEPGSEAGGFGPDAPKAPD